MQVIRVACGGVHSAALTNTGVLLTWGGNAEGQLGYDASLANGKYPRVVEFGTNQQHGNINTPQISSPIEENDEAMGTSSSLLERAPISPSVRVTDISLGLEHTAVVTHLVRQFLLNDSLRYCIL